MCFQCASHGNDGVELPIEGIGGKVFPFSIPTKESLAEIANVGLNT
jgi:hypothetical protein